jgi:DNA ligase-associated metallophosphoesterase
VAARAQLVVDMTAQCLRIGTAILVADCCGIAYWPAQEMLLVADLHLEKASHFAGRGSFLPPYDTRETLTRLAQALTRYAPRHVVALGDSFHSTRGAYDIAGDDLDALLALQQGRTWTWITGNHDPEIAAHVGGVVAGTLEVDGVVLRHEPDDSDPRPQIAGHLHPVARIARGGTSVRRRCFLSDGRRVVMPAFGAFTGGLDILDAAFAPIFPEPAGMSVLMLGDSGLYPVPRHLLTAVAR